MTFYFCKQFFISFLELFHFNWFRSIFDQLTFIHLLNQNNVSYIFYRLFSTTLIIKYALYCLTKLFIIMYNIINKIYIQLLFYIIMLFILIVKGYPYILLALLIILGKIPLYNNTTIATRSNKKHILIKHATK